MKNHIDIFLVTLLFVAVVFNWFYSYSRKKKKKDKECLENFLLLIAKNFHEVSWFYVYLHSGDGLTDTQFAKKITERLRKGLEYEFQLLFIRMYFFPGDIASTSNLDNPSYRFVEKMLPSIRSLFVEYKNDDLIINEAVNNFFAKIEEAILIELARDKKLNFTKE